MSDKTRAVELKAQVWQVKSLTTDDTFHIVFNTGEQYLPHVQKIMEWLKDEVTLLVVKGDPPKDYGL